MKELPKPLTKQDPIRWDYSQEEIEKMMHYLDKAITLLLMFNPPAIEGIRDIKDDWQRKIDWNRERGYWK